MGNFSNVRASSRKASFRTPRLEHLLREELDFLFESEVSDPLLTDLRVERVHLAPNASIATIYVFHHKPTSSDDGSKASDVVGTFLDLGPATRRALQRATPFLRSRLSDVVPLKRSPELRFKSGLPRSGALHYSDEELF